MKKGDDVEGVVSRFARLTEARQGRLLVKKLAINKLSSTSCTVNILAWSLPILATSELVFVVVQRLRYHYSLPEKILKMSVARWVSKFAELKVKGVIIRLRFWHFLGVDSASTGGTWDISNADRLGKSEVQLVNIFIEGLAQIIKWEQALEAGQNIDDQVI